MKTKLLILSLSIFEIANAQGTWTQKANFGGLAKQGAVGFSIGNKGYIGTGADNNGNSKDFWEWDQATNVWTQKADFGGTERTYAVGFSIGIKGYIGTGATYNAVVLQDFWEWDQATNIWTQKANFVGQPRNEAIGFSIGTKGYIGTGNLGQSFTNDFWEWDGDTSSATYNIWTQKVNFGGSARQGAVGFSIGTKGYIGTGHDFSNVLYDDFWEWDQATNLWTQKTNVGGPLREMAVGFSIGTKGYIGTGSDGYNAMYDDFWEWDQTSNTWAQKTNFGGIGRWAAVGFSIGTKGYIGTGSDFGSSSSFTQDFWEYCDTCEIAGIKDLNYSVNISIYPNPFFSVANIQSSKFLKNATLTVYNSSGQLQKQIKNIYGQTITFNRDNLTQGLYYLQLTEDNKIFTTGKIVITDN